MDLCSNISGKSGQIYKDIKFIQLRKKKNPPSSLLSTEPILPNQAK